MQNQPTVTKKFPAPTPANNSFWILGMPASYYLCIIKGRSTIGKHEVRLYYCSSNGTKYWIAHAEYDGNFNQGQPKAMYDSILLQIRAKTFFQGEFSRNEQIPL
jgi:hypothetical protein